MSFDIALYRNTSPVNKVDKSITLVATVSGVLRSGVTVTDPIVLVESQTPATIISGVNYAYISELGRYYHVTGIASDANGLWLISMHVDVLMTYRTQIRSQSAIVARQENVYNMYLDDGWFMSYQKPLIQTKYLSVAAPFENEEYVLVIAGS